MEQPKKPNALAELMANSPNTASRKNNLSAATLKALDRFGPGNATISNSPPRLGVGNVSASSLQKALERFGTDKSEPLPIPGTDWELWAYMPKATLTEAVAVSLGIDPSALKPRSGYAEPGKDFERRLKLACAFVSHAGPLKSLDTLPPNHLMDGPATATVSLPQFAAWALSMGWELPDKFPRLKAAPRQPATNSTAPAITATPNPIYVAIQQIVKSELQKHKPAPVVPIEPHAAPVVVVGAPGGVEPDAGQLAASQPQATTPSPAPVVQAKAKRRTWRDAASPYIVKIMQDGQYTTAKELYRALEAKAGPDSPLDKGTGASRGSLFVREIAQSLSMKTVQNEWQTLRKLAQK